MPGKRTDVLCTCDENRQPSFIRSKTFLGLITISSLLLITFPNYAHVFYPENKEANVSKVERVNFVNVEFKIEGMTCQACAEHVAHEVNQLSGILKSETSYESGNASVEFEAAKTSVKEIENAINSTGYHVTEIKTNK
jgi:copper chaperone CopZ